MVLTEISFWEKMWKNAVDKEVHLNMTLSVNDFPFKQISLSITFLSQIMFLCRTWDMFVPDCSSSDPFCHWHFQPERVSLQKQGKVFWFKYAFKAVLIGPPISTPFPNSSKESTQSSLSQGLFTKAVLSTFSWDLVKIYQVFLN